MYKSTQRGFTLIELVVVIVILGILAAFAVPRFARLDAQARNSSVRALEGALRSGSTLAHSVWLAQGSTGTVPMEGSTIVMANGYPDAATIDDTLADGTLHATTPGRFALTSVNATTVQFRLNGAATPATCMVQYVVAAAADQAPAITSDTAGC